MNRVSAARGIRLVSRKLRSSCWVRPAIRPRIVMNLSAGLASAGGMDSPLPILSLSAAAIAGAAAVFPKLKARLALSRAKHRSLTGHSKMSAWSRGWCRSTNSTSTISSAPTARRPTSRCSARTASSGSPALYGERYAKGRQMTRGGARDASPTCNSPRPTGCRSSTAGWCASISAPAPSCSRRPASPSPISTATCSTT